MKAGPPTNQPQPQPPTPTNLAFRQGMQHDGRLQRLLQQKREIFLLAVLLMAASTSLGKSGEFKLDANGARHRKVFPFPNFARTEDGTDHLGREKRWKRRWKEGKGGGRREEEEKEEGGEEGGEVGEEWWEWRLRRKG